MEQIITIVFTVALVYLLLGLAFYPLFIIKGITQIDPGAKGSSWGFRLIILPGVVLFWPALMRKWIVIRKK
ncbi:MAG: hypothetical protein KGO82_04185 [Bacteroidota bacterium]|nr:hypothetical protein [Bacteroidota bacterium]